jgi:murein DD-endopeptidase MepM/ murein hydrolase activator NlpD
VQEPAAEQPFIGRRARRTGASQTPASDAAPWRSALTDAGARSIASAAEPLGAEAVVEAEPIAPAAAADLKTERLIFDEPAAAEREAANRAAAEQARAERVAAEKAQAERVAAEKAQAEQVAARAHAERVAAEQARAERVAAEKAQAEQFAAQAHAERIAAERAQAERVAAENAQTERVAAAQAHAERIAAEQARADQARAEQLAAEQRRASQASAAFENDERATDPSVDAFSAAAEAFGFSAEDLDETVLPAAESEPEASAGEESDDKPSAAHVAPRRGRRLGRKIAAAGASLGVMGVAGLMLVSMTMPSEAVAAAQGYGAQSVTSLTAVDTPQKKAAENDIQAFVAPSDVESEPVARSGQFSSMSMIDLAAEEGIQYSSSVYTNDTTALIQWPFAVGVAMTWPYGMRRGKMHEGLDLVPGNGAPIQAIADGVVRKATENGGGYGVTVYIDHMIDGKVVTSHYSHMQHGSIRVKTGQQVKVGQIVGLVGNTGHSFGAHLHFELLRNGQTFDPLPWMKKNAGRHDGVGPIS